MLAYIFIRFLPDIKRCSFSDFYSFFNNTLDVVLYIYIMLNVTLVWVNVLLFLY